MAARTASVALLAALWFALSDDASPGEIVSAILVTGLAVAAVAALRRTSEVPSGTKLRWVWQAAVDWPRRILSDSARVLRTVVSRRTPDGDTRRVAVGDASDVAIAWSIVGTSISPNTYVIGFDGEARELLVHELAPTGAPDAELVWRPR